MSCEIDKNSELEQAKQITETTCCCRQFFTTKNICLKILVGSVVIVLSVFIYNEISRWLVYRNVERVANNFFLTTDPFGWTTISGRIEHDIDSINNKMLLCYIVKQQNEIIKKQNSIDSKLDGLRVFQNIPTTPKEIKVPAGSTDPTANTTSTATLNRAQNQ